MRFPPCTKLRGDRPTDLGNLVILVAKKINASKI